MTKHREPFKCGECGWLTSKWVGRCGECQTWGTVEQVGVRSNSVAAGPVSAAAKPIIDIATDAAQVRPTGVDEFDRVLGGGLIPGGVVLLAGEPGVGKSTLLLDVAARAARSGVPTLYVTGEESIAQVRLRADRISAVNSKLWIAAETDLAAVLGQIEAVSPGLLILDSVQTVSSADTEGVAGGVTQVREVAQTITKVAKSAGISAVLVGHVTKDGGVAGPRLLEHLVDVVLSFDGDRHNSLRMVRATKNRFGPTDEVGCFELVESGIRGLPDPSGLFVSRHAEEVSGTCVTVALEGRRPLVCEVQALVAPALINSNPRRTNSGVDPARTAMMLAVLARRARLSFAAHEVYAATVGGVKLRETAADLAIALALSSAMLDRPLPGSLVAVGEIGLAGEVRPVAGIERRLAEASRLGFTHALAPPFAGRTPVEMNVITVPDVGSALRTFLQVARPTAG